MASADSSFQWTGERLAESSPFFSLFALFLPEQQDSLYSKKGTIISGGICLRVTGLLNGLYCV